MILLPRRSERIDLFKNVPLFSNLTKRHLNEISKYASQSLANRGKVLTKQGEKGWEFFLIVSGKARVEQDRRFIRHLSAGDFFGEISLIDGEPRTAFDFPNGVCPLLVST